MIQLKHLVEVEAISFISIAAVVSMVIVIHTNQNNQHKFNIINPIPQTNNVQAATLPTVTPAPQQETTSQVSPNGDKKLMLHALHNADNTITYSVSTADGAGNNQQQVYTTTLPATDTITIPFNTWSPASTYFFIVKNNTDAMVFNASGVTFANGDAFLDATDAFNQKNTGNTLQEATGWASETLIILNTTTSDNTKGPSYWFEIPSKAIIRLSTEF